jgi:hypothetical protein
VKKLEIKVRVELDLAKVLLAVAVILSLFL